MSLEKGCGRRLNNRERTEFLRLVDAGAKIPRFKKNLNLSKKDVVQHLHFLPYHRRYVEVKEEMLKLSAWKFNQTQEEKDKIRKAKVKLRNELNALWNKLLKEWNLARG